MNAGDAFRFIGIADIHVWMIISDPVIDPSRVVIVNFTTWEPHLDQCCIVGKGDHPFLAHRSVVNFSRARLVAGEVLDQLRLAGRLQLIEPLSQELLTRIRRASLDSKTLALEFADILLDQELID